MGSKAGNGRQERLSSVAAIVVVAGAAGAVVSCCALLLLRFQPAFATLLLVASPALIAAAVLIAARHALREAVKPAMATARGHAAVSRLLGAGIGRLARGDAAARIAIDLPAPYEALAHDFNATAKALQAACAEADALRTRLAHHAAALEKAANRLGQRARKLHDRIETDLHIIAALEAHDTAGALQIARHTLQGAGIAARRNIDAAEEIGAMLRPVSENADKAGPAAKVQTDIAA